MANLWNHKYLASCDTEFLVKLFPWIRGSLKLEAQGPNLFFLLFLLLFGYLGPHNVYKNWWINFFHIRAPVHTVEYYSAIRGMKLCHFAATMGGPRDDYILSGDVSQTKTNTTWFHLYVESKLCYKRTCLQNRKRLTQSTDLWLPRGRGDTGGMEWEFGISRCKLL